MKVETQYKLENGRTFSSKEELDCYELLLKTSKFKIGESLIWIGCDYGDYTEQDKFYQTQGKVLDISVKNGKKLYRMDNHGGEIEESELFLDNVIEKYRINHKLRYRGYLIPEDRIIVTSIRKNTRVEVVYKVFKSILTNESNNEYWYYNDDEKLEIVYDGDFLYID